MITLGINTATIENCVMLLENGQPLVNESWLAEQNQAETLLPKIKDALEENKYSFEDVKQIVLVYGPGPFTSLRVGVITANALAYSLKLPIYTISTFDYYRKRLTEPYDHSETALFISAGKNRAYLTLPGQADPNSAESMEEVIEQLKKANVQHLYGNISSEQEATLSQAIDELTVIQEDSLLSFAEAIQATENSELKEQTQVEPLYVESAKITMSDKNKGLK